MASLSRRDFFLLSTFGSAGQAAAQVIGGSGAWSVRGTDPVEIYFGDRRVTAYQSGYKEGLPYCDPIVGPTGGVYTAEGSKGQTGGLWFALGSANGYDFRPGAAGGRKPGRIVHRGMNGVLIRGPAIAIRLKSEWLDAIETTRRICSDQREIVLFHREDGSLAIDLELELTADAGDLAIAPQDAGALALRLGSGFAGKGFGQGRSLLNAEGLVDEKALGARAKWVACQGKEAKGVVAGVAVFDHPSNPGHPAAWSYSEEGILAANPFPADGALPVVVANGTSLHFRYRTIFYEGETAAIDLAKAYEAFSAR